MDGIKERVLQFIEYKGLSVQSFERSVGLSNGAVSKMGNSTRQGTLDKIKSAFPEINISWLKEGTGDMIDLSSSRITQTSDANKKNDKSIKYYYNVYGTMGGVDFLDDPDQSFEYIVMPNISKNTFAIPAYGKSMSPKIADGSIIFCEPWKERFFEWGHIYLIVTNSGHRTIKYVYPSDKEGYITCKSENSDEYPDFDIKGEDIRFVYIVKQWVVRDVM